ncbi:hypothetical protein ACQEVZ_12130 [Dactylosporangium sp. CA-152071]|uniref:hypothetical protein n=1 Tax=Dactylosporangium sp. CA-152071 TaxID=3239933 RepID=UPI003D9452CE
MHLDLVDGRMVAPRMLTVTEYMIDNTCWWVRLPRPLFVRAGERLWLDGPQVVVERLDGSEDRPEIQPALVKWAYKLL